MPLASVGVLFMFAIGLAEFLLEIVPAIILGLITNRWGMLWITDKIENSKLGGWINNVAFGYC
jgi:hypothetical protein